MSFIGEKRDVTVWADELRGMLRASAAFDPTARAYALINALESNAISYQVEVEDLRADASTRNQEER